MIDFSFTGNALKTISSNDKKNLNSNAWIYQKNICNFNKEIKIKRVNKCLISQCW
jgi:hypothetical protein